MDEGKIDRMRARFDSIFTDDKLQRKFIVFLSRLIMAKDRENYNKFVVSFNAYSVKTEIDCDLIEKVLVRCREYITNDCKFEDELNGQTKINKLTQEEDEGWAELDETEKDKIKEYIRQDNADYGACVDVTKLENWDCKFYREGFINDPEAMPSKVIKHPFIHFKCNFYETGSYKDVGKWMLFVDTNKIDQEWEHAYEGLGNDYYTGVHHIKCSTAHESQNGYNPKNKVIIFYCENSSNEARIMAIGRQIIYCMNYTEYAYIYYKTDEQTHAGKVAGGKNHLYKLYTRKKNWYSKYNPDEDRDIILGFTKDPENKLGEVIPVKECNV